MRAWEGRRTGFFVGDVHDGCLLRIKVADSEVILAGESGEQV
jgi:hypothetical protein